MIILNLAWRIDPLYHILWPLGNHSIATIYSWTPSDVCLRMSNPLNLNEVYECVSLTPFVHCSVNSHTTSRGELSHSVTFVSFLPEIGAIELLVSSTTIGFELKSLFEKCKQLCSQPWLSSQELLPPRDIIRPGHRCATTHSVRLSEYVLCHSKETQEVHSSSDA